MLMTAANLAVRHPREGGDPEGEFFQVLKAKDKRKVNLPARSRVLDSRLRGNDKSKETG